MTGRPRRHVAGARTGPLGVYLECRCGWKSNPTDFRPAQRAAYQAHRFEPVTP